MGSEDRGLVLRLGPIQMDVPRSVGYYGGLTAAVGIGWIEPPLALVIGAVPFVKMLTNRAAPTMVRFVGQMFEGAAKPVGSDAEGTIRLDDPRQQRADDAEAASRVARAGLAS